MKIHVIPHVHWDREWYKPFYPSMVRLTKLVKRILELLERDERFKFTFDGHTNWLDDFLRFFPDERERIKRFVKERRLFVGPWFVQADEFAVSGESLIRNLLIGSMMAEEFGHRMNVGYIPDQFGQMENIPQILRGFGIERAMVHRGVGDEVNQDEFWWMSPDGSKVLAYCIKRGYTEERVITKNLEESLENLKRFIESREKENTTGVTVLMDGADFTYPKEYLSRIVESLKKMGVEIEISDLESFFDELERRIPENLPTYSGEFRNPRYDLLVTGVYSTRIHMKKKNLRVSNFLERYVEPLLTLNYILNLEYPSEIMMDVWKRLILCHPHDSISGCGTDEIHRDVETRLRWVEEISWELIRELVKEIFNSRIEHGKELRIDEFMIFNPNVFPYGGIVEVKFKTTERLEGNFTLRSMRDGEKIHCKVLKVEKIQDYIENDGVEFRDLFEVDALVRLENLPSLGFERFVLDEKEGFKLGDAWKSDLEIGMNTLRNEHIEVSVEDGIVNVKDLKTGFTVKTGVFRDDGDAGDEYNFCPPEENECTISPLKLEEVGFVDERPFRVKMILGGYLMLSESLSNDGKRRSERRIKQEISLIFTLHENARFVDIDVEFENVVRDHRLRLLFLSNLRTDSVFAGEPFGLVKRKSVKLTFQDQENQVWKEGYMESDVNFYPFQRILFLADESNGFALSTLDTTEYEHRRENGISILELTLVRAVGYLSRSELPIRSRYAGPIFKTPDAQVLRRMKTKIRLIPSKNLSEIFRISESFLNPPLMVGIPNPTGEKSHFSLLSWDDPRVILSALKKSEFDDRIILRFYNISNEDLEMKLKLNDILENPRICSLDEKKMESISQGEDDTSSILSLKIGGKKIITLSLGFKKKG